jgi:NAD(P)-dependent dehydrogenase (short-subunit alcohol dehydrogenase family)
MTSTTMNNSNAHFEAKNVFALVTGANRGIGRAYAERLARAGASAVYAAARDLASLGDLVKAYPAVIPVHLDVTDPHSIAEVGSRARDVNLLVNNAGVGQLGGVTNRDTFEDARREMEVNYFGLLAMSRAFAPILIANAPSTMVNVLSIASLMGSPRLGTYGASKAAALSATRTIRAELAPKGVHVLGVMPGYVDTDLTAGFDVEKISASDVVDATFAALAAGQEEVYPGAQAEQFVDAFFSDHRTLEKRLASFV